VPEAAIKVQMTAILCWLDANNRTRAALIAGKLAIDPETLAVPPEEG
jgi:DNA-binding NarL/FixJ family response regulator